MNNKKATKAMALVLSAVSVASVGVPVITSSAMIASAATVINMNDLKNSTTVKFTIGGVEVPSGNILVGSDVTINVVPGNYAKNLFSYQYKIVQGSNTIKSASLSGKDSITFKANQTTNSGGACSLTYKVLNRATGESFTKTCTFTIIPSTKAAAGQVVYDTNGNRYKVLNKTDKTLALNGIVGSKNSDKVGYDFEEDTVTIYDTTIDGVKVPLEGFKITEFGAGEKVTRIKLNSDGTYSSVTNEPFDEINIPATVKTIKTGSITSSIINTSKSKNAVVILGSKKTDNLYSSGLTTIESGAINSGLALNKITFRTNHANVAGSSQFGETISGNNAHKMKYSWLKDLPTGANLEAPFGSWSWTLAQLISRFDVTKEETTYTHANGYGATAKKNFNIVSTSNGSLSKPIHDSKYNKDMFIAVYFYNNKKSTANTTPKYRLVIQNGGNPGSIESGTAYVIDESIFKDIILKKTCDKKDVNKHIFTISPNAQAKTGLSNNDKIQCIINQQYVLGANSNDAKITKVDYNALGGVAGCVESSVVYDANNKLTGTPTKLFDKAIKYPVYKINDGYGVGYIAFSAESKETNANAVTGGTGGEIGVNITTGATGNDASILGKFNGSVDKYYYHVNTAAEKNGNYKNSTNAVNLRNVTYTRGNWVTKTVNGKSKKLFEASNTGSKLKINFEAKSYKYYRVEYIDMTDANSEDDEARHLLWDGAAEGVKGFNGAARASLLLDSKTTDNKFYQIIITEYSDAYKKEGYNISAREATFPLIDGRGFLKIYQDNKKLAAGMNDELDLNVDGTRYLKYYGESGKTYRLYKYVMNDKTKVITRVVGSNDKLGRSNTEVLNQDALKLYNTAISYKTLQYSTSDIGVSNSIYCVIKEVGSVDSEANDIAVPTPRVWVTEAKPKNLEGKDSAGNAISVKAGNAIADATKCCTYTARGVKLSIDSGSSSYFKSGNTKKACKAIGPVIAKNGTVSDNKMKMTINVSDFKDKGKVVDRSTIKVMYANNFKSKNFSLTDSSVNWTELPESSGKFTSADSVEFKPVNGLAFYRLAYKYTSDTIDTDPYRYTNVVAVTYNALTDMNTSQQIKAEPLSNIGGSTVYDSSKYNTFSSNSNSEIEVKKVANGVVTSEKTLKQRECFDENGKIVNGNVKGSNNKTYNPLLVMLNSARSYSGTNNTVSFKTDTIPMHNGSAKITINNAYSSVPAKSSLTPVLKNSKNIDTFDGIVSENKYLTVSYSNDIYYLTVASNEISQAQIIKQTTIDRTTGETNITRVGNVSYTANKPLDQAGSVEINFSTVKDDNSVDNGKKYIAIVQTATVKNPSDSGVDTQFTSDGAQIKSESRVYFLALTGSSYKPISEFKNNMVVNQTGNNTDELVIKVKGCSTTANNNIFKTYYKISGQTNKLFNTEIDLDDNGKLDEENYNKLVSTFGVFNPSKVDLIFKCKLNDGTQKSVSITVNKPTFNKNGDLKTTFGSSDKTSENNSSRFIVGGTSGNKVTGIEYVIPASRVKQAIDKINTDAGTDNTKKVDIKAFNGVIKAYVRVYSNGINYGTVAGGTEVATTMPNLVGTGYRGNVNIDVSSWK